MSRRRRHEVIVTAPRTVAVQLRRQRGLLAGLPPGDPSKLAWPAGSPAGWPSFTEARAT